MADIKFKATVDSQKGEVSLSQLDKGVGELEKSTKKAAGGFGSLAAKVAVGVTAFYAAFRAAKGLIGAFIDTASQVESYQLRLDILLGSQEAATEAMRFFKDVASKLPFTLQQVVESGVKISTATDEFKKWLVPVADVSAAMGMELPLAADQMVRAFSAGLGACDLFRERGVTQLIKSYAKLKFGIDDLSTVSLPKQREVMYAAFTDMEYKFAGATDRLRDSWVGMVSMLGDAWFQFKSEIMEAGIFEMMKEGLQGVLDWIEKFKAAGGFEDVALQVSMTGEVLGVLRDEVNRQLAPLKWLKDAIVGTKGREDEFAEATRELKEALARAGIELIDTTELTHYQASEMMTAAESTAIFTRRAEALAFSMEDVWDALKLPSELMGEWDALFALVETPELDLAFEQFAISAEDNFANVMESMGFFVRDSEEKAEAYKKIMKGMTEAQKEFSAIALGELMNMEAGLKGMVDAILNTFEKWALGAVVKSTMTLPFPANLLASAVAIAAVKAIFKEIKGMEKGGWVGLQGEEVVRVGERGPEYITPNRMLGPLAPARKVEATFTANFFITSPDTMGWQRITREKIAPEFIEWVRLNRAELLDALGE